MKKLIATMVLGLGLALAACSGPTSSACGDESDVGKCTDVEYCCTANLSNTSCYWKANGKKYSCSGVTDCTAAVEQMNLDCQ